MNSKIITPVFTGIQQCEALLPPFERACTAAIDVSGGSVQELIYSSSRNTRDFRRGIRAQDSRASLESDKKSHQTWILKWRRRSDDIEGIGCRRADYSGPIGKTGIISEKPKPTGPISPQRLQKRSGRSEWKQQLHLQRARCGIPPGTSRSSAGRQSCGPRRSEEHTSELQSR